MPITPLNSTDTFKTWFDTTNTIISTVNGISGINGTGISGPYVVSFNGSTGVITFSNYVSFFNGLTGSVSGVTGVVGGLGISISGTATNPTITNTGVLSVNGYTNTPTGFAELAAPQIFTALQQFTSGISANGATFSGPISAPNVVATTTANTFTALQTFNSGITAAGATLNGNVSIGGNTTITGTTTITGNVTAPNIVTSLNGLTGALQGVTGIFGTASQITVSGVTGAVTVSLPSVITGITSIQSTVSRLTLKTNDDSVTPSILIMNSVGVGSTPFSTLTGNLTVSSGLSAASLGISGAATITGSIRAGSYLGNLVNTFNGFTGAVVISAGPGVGITTANKLLTVSNTGVLSFNGVTGDVSGVIPSTSNTFTAVQTFTAGISANGATFSGPISAPNVVTTTNSNIFTALQRFTAGLCAGIGTITSQLNAGSLVVGTSLEITEKDGGKTSIGIGKQALQNLFAGIQDTAIGYESLNGLLDGNDNTAVGYLSAQNTTSGSNNTAIGSVALNKSDGDSNTAIGMSSLFDDITGSENTAVGKDSLKNKTTGSNNTAVGYRAGYYRGTGTSLLLTGATGGIYIGNQARASAENQYNEIVIGYDALGLGSNTAVLGATLQQSATIYGQLRVPGGLSAANGITLSGNFTGATATFSGLLTANRGISATDGAFSGAVVSGGTLSFGRAMDTTANNKVIMNSFKVVSKTGLTAEVCKFDIRYYNVMDVTSTGNIIDTNTTQGQWPGAPGTPGTPGMEQLITPGYFLGRKDLIVTNGIDSTDLSDTPDIGNYASAISLARNGSTWYWEFGCNVNGNTASVYILPWTRQTAIFSGCYTLIPLGLTG
jgi:hypothetical protein